MKSLRTAMKDSPRSPQLEKACAQQRRPNAAKKKKIKKQTNKQKDKLQYFQVIKGYIQSQNKHRPYIKIHKYKRQQHIF